ncbi:winged helix-turn-helix domain-containing protein [Tropicimonas marinistellae]|uniref:winged helix-turn-helix domain-containing protein n=1 Tax=Tropicimonas marinistellae TaxID=1739787 RepID=UPI0013730BE8|nr:winged helix-turn-helix domain-containing protein [Tropicimonas marinistellae]
MAHLRPKSYRVLEVLSERRGELVPKDDLIAAVWQNVVVTDESLSQCISDIRRALGKDAAYLLRTVPRRGYVLDAEQLGIMAALQRKPAILAGASLAGVCLAGIGVTFFPFGTKSPDPPIPSHIPSNAPERAATASHWPDWRDRAPNDDLRARLEAAIANDPTNAVAWAKLGQTYWLEVKYSAWGGGRRELDKALDALERALALEGGSEAYRTLADIRLDAPYPDARSRVDALAMAQAAANLSPSDPDAMIILAAALTANDRAEDAVPILERALAEVPTPPDRYREVAGMTYLLAGAPSKAVEEFGRLHGAGTFGGTRHYAGWFLAASLAHADRVERARIVLEEALETRPEKTLDAVALSLGHLDGQELLEVVLEGLRLAGVQD